MDNYSAFYHEESDHEDDATNAELQPPYMRANAALTNSLNASSDSFSPTPSLNLAAPGPDQDMYQNFVSQHPVVQGSDQGQRELIVPSIHVAEAGTPEVIANASPTIPIPTAQSRYFNENDYYYANNGVASNARISASSERSNFSTFQQQHEARPILNYPSTNYSSEANNSFSMNDAEYNYIDQTGDDYQINTYLDRNGEMVDPYNQDEVRRSEFLSPYESKYYGGSSDRTIGNIPNKYSHVDLGEYESVDSDSSNDKIATVNPVSSATSSYTAHSNENLLDGEQDAARPVRRNTTVLRKFKLWMGNFIFDSPISKSLLSQYLGTMDNEKSLPNEFKFMRYQAITCEPDKMAEENFHVRQSKYSMPRQTELMIVITMYNEDHVLLGRTLKGVMDNIKFMVRKKHSSTWGPDAWKKIVVCIISDGRSKINEKALALLSSLGCYQDGFAKDEVNDKKVKMHMYEHTTKMNIGHVSSKEVKLVSNQNTVPVQLLFALKEQNQKKINSHRWAFEGFAELLQPNIITLLDAGTMPGKDSIYELWREFRNPQVGGACGEIKTDLGKRYRSLLNPLVASQNFEYKMSNILDKTTESNFGFITVLPGAFSAYRFVALQGQPLEKYFYGEHMEDDQENLHFFSSNMYLAEDRILCFEIVTKRHCNWILRYCRSAYASTDVPNRVPEFILQRRRWLNGSFFASIFSFYHFYRIWTSGHSIIRKLMLQIEFVYLLFNTLISWFSLSSFFLVFRILTVSIALTFHSVFNILSVVFLWLYGVCLLSTFILSLGNKPKSTEFFYVLTCIFFAILMAYMIFCSFFMSVKSFENLIQSGDVTFKGLITTETFRDMVISMGSTYCLYFISSLVYLQPWHMITSFIQYLLLSPSYINVLNIYAFCNVHDLSWGTKGSAVKPLGKINTKDDGTFKMEILVSSEEIQANYTKYLRVLQGIKDGGDEATETNNSANFEERKTGYYANIRSLVIIFWILTNFGVIVAVLETGGVKDYLQLRPLKVNDQDQLKPMPLLPDNATIYFTIILWLVALLAVIRFFGCAIYMASRIVKGVGITK